jgi:hypothetical protein
MASNGNRGSNRGGVRRVAGWAGSKLVGWGEAPSRPTAIGDRWKANHWRRIRWGFASVIILGVLAASIVPLVTAVRLACQVTIAPAGTTKVCGAPDITNYTPELALIVLLLVPWWRVKHFRLGPFEAELLREAVNTVASQAGVDNVAQDSLPLAAILQDFPEAG